MVAQPQGFLLLAAALALLAPLAAGQGWPDHPPAVFRPGLALLGEVVAECGYTSPMRNDCAVNVPSAACQGRECSPNMAAGLGFIGTITATVQGTGWDGTPASVWYGRSYAASSTVNVWGLGAGGEWSGGSGNALVCDLWECWYVLWPPFRLVGSVGPLVGGTSPVGPWRVMVEAEG